MPRRLLSLLLLAGCSSSPPAPERHVQDPLAVLRAVPAFAGRLGESGRLSRNASGYFGEQGPVHVRIPNLADGVSRVAHHALAAAWIDIRAEGLRSSTGRAHGSAITFADAAEDTDVVFVADPNRFEELRVVRSPAALHPITWTLRIGPGLHDVRVANGRLEALESDGTPRLHSDPLYAVDANGIAIPLSADVHRLGVDLFRLTITPMPTSEVAYPIAIDPSWSATTATLTARVDPTGVVLDDGKVLLLGGFDPGGAAEALKSTEIFDPGTSTWKAGPSMIDARASAGVARMLDGRYLVVGGFSRNDGTGCLQSAEIYDPAAGTWTKTAPMLIPRSYVAVITLTSGKVIVPGGSLCGTTVLSTEIYDPSTDTWVIGPPMNAQRSTTSYAMVGVDQFILAGSEFPAGQIDYFDGKKFIASGSVGAAGYPGLPVAIAPGRVLIPPGFQGSLGGTDQVTKIWELSTKTTKNVASTLDKRWASTTVAIPGGNAVSIGGTVGPSFLSTNVFYDAAADTWSTMATQLQNQRRAVLALPMKNGGVIAIGGAMSSPFVAATKFVDVLEGCTSGFAADGVCCDKACAGSCESCNLTGKVGTCSPIGAGPPVAYRSCGKFLCGATACLTKCTTDTECVDGMYCDSAGQCAKRLSTASKCTSASQCVSGNCADGHCCDTACKGQCEACDLSGIEGTCGPVTGAPHGTRTACEGAADECGKTCNGLSRDACVFRGAEKSCGNSGCVGTTFQRKGVCSAGMCTGLEQECSPYLCGAMGCSTTCAVDIDCAKGFSCVARACVPKVATDSCSPDGLSQIKADGTVVTCVAYRCRDNQCPQFCGSSEDCLGGYVCDVASRACIAASSGNADAGGGCSIPSGRASKIGAALLLALVAASTTRRRRRC